MPFYEYRCENCEAHLELFHGINEDARKQCESCHEPALKRIVFPTAVIYKGSGYYTTEYKKSSPGKSESSSSSSETKSEGSSESKSDSKSETKTETKADAKPATTTPPTSKEAAAAA